MSLEQPPKRIHASKSKAHAVPVRDRLTAAEIEDIKSIFDLFDEEGKGVIDPAEILKILQELGLDKRNHVVSTLLNDLQVKNKQINFEEFLEIVYNRLGDTKTKDGLRKVFALYDTDDSEYIDLDKLKVVARELGETMTDEELGEMMHNTHVLHRTETNEAFSFEEFYEIVTRKRF